MKWYSKYLEVFEKPFSTAPQHIIDDAKAKLAAVQSENPIASVVVIAYNDETRLLSCLWSLSESKCKYPIEIIGVDNNSADRTADVYNAVGLRFYNEDKKSCGYARNRGLQEAKGKYYICIDSDTMYPEKYVETMIDALEKPGVVAVSSLWSYVPSKEYPRFWMFFYELLRDTHLFLQSFKSPERSVRGLVFAYNIEFGRKVGYRVQIIRGEDGAMAYGLKQYGEIAFVRGRKARAISCTSTISADGSLKKAFWTRVRGVIKGIRKYFVKVTGEVKDQPSNLIKNK
ncbi:MAG: glycosyltransferase family A protein [Bacteroidales bacterium]|jgi:glycosyltransferase involved in cell wall biosynthesis